MGYKLYQSNLIKNNHQEFVNECSTAYNIIKQYLNTDDTTWNFFRYNFFGITGSSLLFYELFKELNFYIRDYIGDNRPLWMQSWLNYHINDKILDDKLGKFMGFHSHDSVYHGYISISPQNTFTIFKNGIKIKNQIGQIYIGPGRFHELGKNEEYDHYVSIISPSISPRITIAFDITDVKNIFLTNQFNIPLL